MPAHLYLMPLDRTTIKTRLRIRPDLIDHPADFIRAHDLPVRTSKPSRGQSKHGPTRNLSLDVLAYKGIKVKIRNVADDPLTEVTIHFNPGVCLRGHNGAVLALDEFLHALGILVTHLKPLLSNPEDWIDLIPGLRAGGVAYWHYLEVLLQCSDPKGRLLASFRNAQGKTSQTPIRHWPESMVIGSKNSDLRFGVYRKAVEMTAKNKLPPEPLENFHHILRLEVRLKGQGLVQHLGNERNVEVIDGKERLVRFYPADLVQGHRDCFGRLQGVFASAEQLNISGPRDQRIPLGRLLARVALDPRSSHTLQELLAHIRFYTGASTDTMGPIRNAGIAQLEILSATSKDELFSDDAYRTRLSIWNKELENEVLHDAEDAAAHRLITGAYRPPNLPFKPVVLLPDYLRVCPPSDSTDPPMNKPSTARSTKP